VRPPCPQAEAPGALDSLAEHLLHRTGSPFWHDGTYTLQLSGPRMLMVRGGKITVDSAAPDLAPPAMPSSAVTARYPVLRRVGPRALQPGKAATLKLHGSNLNAQGVTVRIGEAGAMGLAVSRLPVR
jgi:hypothetical protein